jgi:sterol desaturase/sphingolipid hydroxylase (fatty acid hydroxylase superfamily)
MTIPNEAALRVLAFALVLGLLAIWERCAVARERRVDLAKRWVSNLGLGAVSTGVLRLLFPAGAVGAALLATQHHIGIFNVVLLPGYVTFIASLILLDLTIYLQHWMLHALPWLWRIHRVHHADPEVDVSTALRFHPAESLLSMILKVAVVFALGMLPLAVLVFEIVLNAAAMFNHANATLPRRIEPWLRSVVVTPDMHCIHHSIERSEANSNFGFNLSWWDRLFGTYRAPSAQALRATPIGLPDAAPEAKHVWLSAMLLMPFAAPVKKTITEDVTSQAESPPSGASSEKMPRGR